MCEEAYGGDCGPMRRFGVVNNPADASRARSGVVWIVAQTRSCSSWLCLLFPGNPWYAAWRWLLTPICSALIDHECALKTIIAGE